MRSDSVMVEVKMDISQMTVGQRAGLVHFNGGRNHAYIGVHKQATQICIVADKMDNYKGGYMPNQNAEEIHDTKYGVNIPSNQQNIWFRSTSGEDDIVDF